jgi:hypothetical protein
MASAPEGGKLDAFLAEAEAQEAAIAGKPAPAEEEPELRNGPADGGVREPHGRTVDASIDWRADPFAELAGSYPAKAQAPSATIPRPGSTIAITEDHIVREGLADFPDDVLVSVELRRSEGGAVSNPLMIQHNVLYSVAKEPLSWIPYGGVWVIKYSMPQLKKQVTKTVETPGPVPPIEWRPRIGGGDDDMDDTTFMAKMIASMQRMGMAAPGVQQQQGVQTEIYGGMQQGLRADIMELRADVKRLEKERDQSRDTRNNA